MADASNGSDVLSMEEVYALARWAGADDREARILVGIAIGESGLNRLAHNSDSSTFDDSFGIWQINMYGSMGPQRARSWGLTSYTQLFDPLTNAKAAIDILRSQGLRAWSVFKAGTWDDQIDAVNAAAQKVGNQYNEIVYAMASGGQYEINPAFAQYGVPPAPASPASDGYGLDENGFINNTGGGMTTPPLSPTASEQEIEDYIIKNYGPAAMAFLKIPELRTALLKAAQAGAVGYRGLEYVYKTPWWTTRSETMRTFDTLEITDPAEFKRQLDAKVAQLEVFWSQLGLDANIQEVARDVLRLGLNEAELNGLMATALTKESKATGLDPNTSIKAQAENLMAIARKEYLTPIDQRTAESWAIKSVKDGIDVESAFRSYMMQISAARFGLDPTSGITPADVVGPLRMAIASSLEIEPNAIDLTDSKWSDVLSVRQEDGTYRMMTANEATQWARSKSDFRGTKLAQDTAAGLGEQLAKTFGMVG